MPEERQFPRGSRVDDLDLSGVHLHGTNLEGARLTETYLMDADISGDIEGLRLNGVEIEPLVRAELDRLYPDRVKLRASDVAGLREAWSMVERLWAATTDGRCVCPRPSSASGSVASGASSRRCGISSSRPTAGCSGLSGSNRVRTTHGACPGPVPTRSSPMRLAWTHRPRRASRRSCRYGATTSRLCVRRSRISPMLGSPRSARPLTLPATPLASTLFSSASTSS